jgi:YegS/Rv2252/BmrU family lipid kinase
MKALVLLNSNARRSGNVLEVVQQDLSEAGIEAEIVRTDTEDEALKALQGITGNDNSGDIDAIIVGGGDGTLNALLPGLLDADKPLGILPLGTANDFAASLELPDDVTGAVGVIAAGLTLDVDVAYANGAPFLNTVNIGLGERIAAEHHGFFKTLFGKLAYPFHWWRAWRNNDPFAATVVADDGHPVRFKAEQVSVSNSESFGGGLRLDDSNAVDSGKLAVAGLRPKGFLSWIRLTLKLATGRLRDSDAAGTMSVRNVRIETQPERRYTADGEDAGRTPVEISVRKRTLTVFVPAGNSPGP